MASKIMELNTQLIDLQTDQDGLFRNELNQMREGSMDSFYAALHSTREYYEKFPNLQYESTFTPNVSVQVDFSGEEIFGKYLDLNPLFLEFCNLLKKKSIEQDYLQYLDRFSMFFYIPEEIKATKGYYEYLLHLWNYLVDFYQRVHPLISLNKVFADWEEEFQIKVTSGEIVIYTKPSTTTTTATSTTNHIPEPLRLGMFNSVEELEALGLERLKEGLEALGLKCGGSLNDRAKRLWSIRGKKVEDIPNNLKVKTIGHKASSNGNNSGSHSNGHGHGHEELFKDGKPSHQVTKPPPYPLFYVSNICIYI